jgi:hypothetical protein
MSVIDSQEHALADLVASQHAAVYAYGVIAANVDDPDPALNRLAIHRRKRDELIAIASQSDYPVAPAAAAYSLPNPVTDAASAIACATTLEEKLCAHWSTAIPFFAQETKLQQIVFTQDCAKRAFEWSGIAKAFYQ